MQIGFGFLNYQEVSTAHKVAQTHYNRSQLGSHGPCNQELQIGFSSLWPERKCGFVDNGILKFEGPLQ